MPFDMRPFVHIIPNQRGNSCVGHAIAQCLRVRAAISGINIDPSALAIYAEARALEHRGAKILPDVGSYPEHAFAQLRTFGAVARSRWDDESSLEEPVPEDVYEAGFIAVVIGEYVIPTGRGAWDGIRKAHAARRPVFWARDVDTAYEDLGGELYRGITEPVRGGHAGCLVFSDDVGSYDAGSWGRQHGANGFAHVSREFIESEHVHTIKAFTATIAVVQ